MRNFIIALLFALAAALPCYIVSRSSHSLEFLASAGKNAAVKLTIDVGYGLNEDFQFLKTLEAQKTPVPYRFALPEGRYRGYRIDFIDVDDWVAVSDLKIVDENNTTANLFPAKAHEIDGQSVPSEQSELLKIAPVQGSKSSGMEIKFQKPLRLRAAYKFWQRTTCAVPILLATFALVWLVLKRFGSDKLYSWFCGKMPMQNPASPIPGSTAEVYPRWIFWLTLSACGLMLFARMPDRLLLPQLHAEDGYYYSCAVEAGLKSFFMPYNGYLLTADRVIAALGVQLPALYAPLFFNVSALLITLVVLGSIFSPRVNLPCKPLLAVAVAMFPRPEDVLMTITNIQWVLAVGLILLLISEDACRPKQYLYDCTYALITGLTGVYSILLLPFFTWRAIRRKTLSSITLATVVIITAAIQAWFVMKAPHPAETPCPVSFLDLIRIIGFKYFCLPYGGPWLAHPKQALLTILGFVFIIWAAFLCVVRNQSPARLAQRLLLVAIITALTAAALYRYKDMLPMFLRSGGTRYFFVGEVLFVWLIISELRAGVLRRGLAMVALYAYLVTGICTFRLEPFVNYHWSEYTAAIDEGQSIWLPTNPPGWRCYIPAREK